jgi:hypothetical protein
VRLVRRLVVGVFEIGPAQQHASVNRCMVCAVGAGGGVIHMWYSDVLCTRTYYVLGRT